MSELDKKLMQTPDLNKERLEKLKSLFPDLFTVEGKLNPDELKKIVDPGLVKETERFEFKWFGKSEAKRNAFTPSKATLIYDEERGVNPEYVNSNMIIESENLLALKCLLSAYRERVKCIYIDPPYNIGNDFIYNDKWDESKEDYWENIGITNNGIKLDTNLETDGRFHSNWLNMMYPRLLLARQLLSEDGIICISIDNNEEHHLRKLCDEVFGKDNFLGYIARSTGQTTGQDSGGLGSSFDFIIAYGKYPEVDIGGLPLTPKDLKRFDNEDERGKYAYDQLRKTGSGDRRIDRPNMYYPTKDPDGNEVYPIAPEGYEGRWRVEEKKYYKLVEEDYILWNKTKRKGEEVWWPYVKYYAEGRTKRPSPLWTDLDGNKKASRDLKKLFDDEKIFDYPKPVSLIKRLISIIPNAKKDDIVLDFFAGSGTTGEAVIKLNNEDGWSRSFILIQIPETVDDTTSVGKNALRLGYKKISDITIERNKRVIQKIEKEEAEKQPSLLDSDKKPFKTGFKVYKLAKSNFPRVDFAPDPAKTEEENLALLNKYIDEKEAMFLSMVDEKNIFDEVLLKNGFMLNYLKFKVDDFSKNNVFQIKDDFKECLICMDMNLSKETLKELEQFKDKIFICLERALDTTMKWNLKHLLGDKLIAF